jgi:thiamine biosynthesis lipoprotein
MATSNRTKNIIYSLALVAVFLLVQLYRSYYPPQGIKESIKLEESLIHLQGTTMGVVAYNVKYIDSLKRDFQSEIDTLLKAFNQSLSTYVPDSEISRFNRQDSLEIKSRFFYPVLKASQEVYQNTEGAFDPTVAPLVNAWGFGFKEESLPTAARIDSLKALIGYDYITFNKQKIIKKKSKVMLDMSAVAKGYAVDVVADLLAEKGIKNYFVEIGGEIVCKGKNERDELWTLGITNPRYKEAGQAQAFKLVKIENKAMATSGNYENYHVIEGKKYAHTINPQTGYPIEHSLKSASVFAPDCMRADAYATAFMVLGFEKSKEILAKTPNLDAYLIYEDEKGNLIGFATEGIKAFIVE